METILYAVLAIVQPITTTQPITYVWQATGQQPVIISRSLSWVGDIGGCGQFIRIVMEH